MRPIIYPAAEELILNKKQRKFEEGVAEDTRYDNNRRRGKRKKDTIEDKRAKEDARKRRKAEAASSSSANVCKSCGQPGHTTAASRMCPNHQFSLKERLEMAFPESYQRFTISLTLGSFLRFDEEEDPNKLLRYQERISELSIFLRQVVYKAQIFINYYILTYSNRAGYLSNDIFEKNFWYRVCRLVYRNITIEQLQGFYPRLPGLQTAFNRFQELNNVNLFVERNYLVVYGQIISTACGTVATAYSNFYLKNL